MVASQIPVKRDFWPGLSAEQRRWFVVALGALAFLVFYFLDGLPDAVDPKGKVFSLSSEGQAAIALFFLAAIWWIFEVMPVGVTGIAIGVVQVLFLIRPARDAFADFMDPAVLFIFGSLVIGTAFSKVGLTRRLAYAMLLVMGERTVMIYLGCFVVTALLTHFMAHTAVAATMFPILMAIYTLYDPENRPSRFGRGLFIGMAFVAGAGSMITLLGAARGAVALGFYRDITGHTISFVELSYFMLPAGWLLIFLMYLLILVMFPPERSMIPGLQEKARRLHSESGPFSRRQWFVASTTVAVLLLLSLQTVIPFLATWDKAAVVLLATLVFFLFRILSLNDLEALSWNIVLLFAGAMSMGFCLWETGAAQWLAIHWLSLFQHSHWFVFILAFAIFVLLLTNVIMNVAAIAVALPVGLVVAPYLNISQEVILYTSLFVAACPCLFLVGAAPNAIAYDSRQFSAAGFFRAGLPATLVVMLALGLSVAFIWPILGMSVS